MVALSVAFVGAGRPDKALPLCEQALAIQQAKLGAGHPETLRTKNYLAMNLELVSHWSAAEAVRRDLLALRRKSARSDSLGLANDLGQLALDLTKQGKWSEAEPILRASVSRSAPRPPRKTG